MSARTEAMQELLVGAGCPGRIRILPESTHTAAQAAAVLDSPLGAIASSLVLQAGDEPVLVMTSGAHRIDTELLSRAFGAPVGMAPARVVKQVTGQPIGGVAPIGHPSKLRTIVDSSLEQYDELWAAGGTPNSIFPLSYADLLRITDGVPMRVSAT